MTAVLLSELVSFDYKDQLYFTFFLSHRILDLNTLSSTEYDMYIVLLNTVLIKFCGSQTRQEFGTNLHLENKNLT